MILLAAATAWTCLARAEEPVTQVPPTPDHAVLQALHDLEGRTTELEAAAVEAETELTRLEAQLRSPWCLEGRCGEAQPDGGPPPATLCASGERHGQTLRDPVSGTLYVCGGGGWRAESPQARHHEP